MSGNDFRNNSSATPQFPNRVLRSLSFPRHKLKLDEERIESLFGYTMQSSTKDEEWKCNHHQENTFLNLKDFRTLPFSRKLLTQRAIKFALLWKKGKGCVYSN
ncbi:hypothetical protein HA466_0143880 [Hirschfeldia incana]|nr:hypothetical protein HA466_0143880 [Hirschfeldia incana]